MSPPDMRRRLAFLALLTACLTWAECACAAITATSAGATNSSTNSVTTLTLATTAAASVGDTLVVADNFTGNATVRSATDTVGNTYTEASTVCTFNVTNKQSLFYAKITTALPAAVNATGAITTTTVTFTTNPGTLAVNQTIGGAGVTAATLITGGISQWNGTTASATVNNSQTVVSETLTVSSGITLTWTTAAKAGMAAAVLTNLDTSAPLDVQGACNTGTATAASIATGTLNHASEIVIGALAAASQTNGYVSNSPFTDLTGETASSIASVNWGYDVVAATTTVTYAPTWTSSRSYSANVWTFAAPFTPAVTGPTSRQSLMGIGK